VRPLRQLPLGCEYIPTDGGWRARLWLRGAASPVCKAVEKSPVPKMPEGFHANAENEHSWEINEKEATD
jgi:hypothetical protein